MPIPVTKYRCKFKCGKRAMNSVKDADKHESSCFRNPESKTCETCINREYESDYDEFSVWHGRGCKISRMNAFLEEIQDLITMDNNHVKPLWGCPNHNRSDESPLTEEYIKMVTIRIHNKNEKPEPEINLPF